MINAGAIATVGMVGGKNLATRLQRILQTFSLYAGREVSLDEQVYRSESETGHRNRAIGHLLRNFNILTEPPDPVVDLYFKQCSISVTCRDLAVMAATLANHGVNPLTRKQAIRGEYVESVLSVMASCGMYDYAGEWLYRIGMPAKSGVSGGLVAVLPGQLGIGVFSPPLDARGNSVRGIKVCDAVSRTLDLHLFNSPHTSQSVIRLRFSGADVNSSRLRTAEESRLLRESGGVIRVYQLQGNLVFSTVEVVVRDVLQAIGTLEYLILDLKQVANVDESACRLLYQLLVKLSAANKPMVFTGAGRFSTLRRFMRTVLGGRFEAEYRVYDDNDAALEWCENRFLDAQLPSRAGERRVAIESYDLFRGLSPKEIEVVAAGLERRHYRQGEVLVQMGEEAREVFLIASGSAMVTVRLASGAWKRLGVFSPGMALGEMGILDRAPRSAVVVADTDLECDLLKLEDFEKLGETHPRIKIVLLTNMALGIARRLRKTTQEISVFDY